MLLELLKNKKFKSKIRNFLKKHEKEIIDIILFGSTIRGKRKPKDIDILILFKEKENIDLNYELRKSLEKINLKAEIIGKTYKNMLSTKFLPREDILSDGFSLILNKKISQAFGYESFIMFKYSLKGFGASKRMMFYYALVGRRDKKGIIQELHGIKFTNAVVLVPLKNSALFEEFLNNWKIKTKKTRILIPSKTIEFTKFNEK